MSDTVSVEVTTPLTPSDAPSPVVDPARPAWLDAKFKTPEDLATAYKELEKKQSTPAPVVEPPKPSILTDEATLKSKGIDLTKLNAEYAANDGKLSADSLAQLKAAGITDAQVTSYIADKQIVADAQAKDVHDSVGGKERFDKLQEFGAAGNLTAAEIASYNKALLAGDFDTVKLMLGGLNSKYTAQFGNEPNLTTGRPATVTSDVFENFQAYRTAQADPRYGKDSNFMKALDDKLERSPFWQAKA